MSDKIYFVCSDIHGHYTAFIDALKQCGWEENNSQHVIIVCGDLFDRSLDPTGPDRLVSFFKGLPKDRYILIKGNHEYLFEELLTKKRPGNHDYGNGTVRTFCNIAGVRECLMDAQYLDDVALSTTGKELTIEELYSYLDTTWETVKQKVEKSVVYDFLKNSDWKHYYEIDEFIFAHAFLPSYEEDFTLLPDWRNAPDFKWKQAVWVNNVTALGFDALLPETEQGKVLVCGHKGAHHFHRFFNNEKPYTNYKPYFSNALIAIDGTTVVSGTVNIIKITPDGVFDQENQLRRERTGCDTSSKSS